MEQKIKDAIKEIKEMEKRGYTDTRLHFTHYGIDWTVWHDIYNPKEFNVIGTKKEDME